MEETVGKKIGEVVHSTELCESESKREELEELLVKQEAQRVRKPIKAFWQRKYENESQKYWDLFYKRNTDHFFKDRHYIAQELSELGTTVESCAIKQPTIDSLSERKDTLTRVKVIELGCGVGNALLPLLKEYPRYVDFIGYDISPRAVQIIQEKSQQIIRDHRTSMLSSLSSDCSSSSLPSSLSSSKSKSISNSTLRAFTLNIVTQELNTDFMSNHFGILLFVLSSIHPRHHSAVLRKTFDTLCDGGTLFFRDYALYDLAQIRFKGASKLEADIPYYVRDDGTTAYYFTREELAKIIDDINQNERINYHIKITQSVYCKKTVINRKLKTSMNRIWIQCKFVKIGRHPSIKDSSSSMNSAEHMTCMVMDDQSLTQLT